MKFQMVKNGLKEHFQILKREDDAVLTWKNDFKDASPGEKRPRTFEVNL